MECIVACDIFYYSESFKIKIKNMFIFKSFNVKFEIFYKKKHVCAWVDLASKGTERSTPLDKNISHICENLEISQI